MQKLKPNKKTVILTVAPCLLNPKLRANGLSQHPGIKQKIIKLARKYNAKIEELPCPEFLFLGEREPKTYDEYMELEAHPTRPGGQGFKGFCEKLAEDVIENLEKFKDYHIVFIGIARSPSCSVSYVYDRNNNLKKGEGILIHFLRNKVKAVFLEMDYHKIDGSIKEIKAVLETILLQN